MEENMTIKTSYLNPAQETHLGAMRWTLFLGVFATLSMALPSLCHQFGLAGMVFLPIHFSVFIAAIVMGMRGGVVVALISPALSFAVSAMPPAASLLPMTLELVIYAIAINIFSKKYRLPLIAALAIAMLCGRAVSILIIPFILQTSTLPQVANNLFIVGIPGVLLQLLLVPPISSKVVKFLNRK